MEIASRRSDCLDANSGRHQCKCWQCGRAQYAFVDGESGRQVSQPRLGRPSVNILPWLSCPGQQFGGNKWDIGLRAFVNGLSGDPSRRRHDFNVIASIAFARCYLTACWAITQ